jgi:hypothetical protein
MINASQIRNELPVSFLIRAVSAFLLFFTCMFRLVLNSLAKRRAKAENPGLHGFARQDSGNSPEG